MAKFVVDIAADRKITPEAKEQAATNTNKQNEIKRRPRNREPQSVTALRAAILNALDSKTSGVIKLDKIAKEIGFSRSWLTTAKSYLAEHGEFSFERWAEGADRGTQVTKL